MDKRSYHAGQCSLLQNNAGTCVSDWHKIDTTETRFVLTDENKNRAGTAIPNAAIDDETHEKSHAYHTKKPRRSAMSKWAKKAHKRTARVIGYALTLGTFEAWQSVALLLRARLTPQERAALAFAVLSSLDEDDAYQVASLAIFGTVRGRAV